MNRRQFLAAAAAVAIAPKLAAAETTPLRVAVIGHTGRGNYGHGLDTMWLRLPETKIVAVADADKAGLAAAREKLAAAGEVAAFGDYRKMLAEVKPDLVAVAPRFVDEHCDMTLAAIESGAKGIYIEKPLCRSLEEADALVVASEKAGTRIAIAHRNRYHPALPAVLAAVKEGAIGKLLEIRTRGREDDRGGVTDLWVLGSHLLNLCPLFAGAPTACSAVVLQDGRPVTAADIREGGDAIGPIAGNALHARFETETNIPVYFDSIKAAGVKPNPFGVQLIGTLGIIDLRIDQHPLAHYLKGQPHQPSSEPRQWVPISSGGIGVPEPIADAGRQVSSHALAARDLIAAIREKREPLCGIREGRLTVEMISAALESHRLNGARVTFPLVTRKNPLTLLGKA